LIELNQATTFVLEKDLLDAAQQDRVFGLLTDPQIDPSFTIEHSITNESFRFVLIAELTGNELFLT